MKTPALLCPSCEPLTRALALGRSIRCRHRHVTATMRRGGLVLQWDDGHALRMHGPAMPLTQRKR